MQRYSCVYVCALFPQVYAAISQAVVRQVHSFRPEYIVQASAGKTRVDGTGEANGIGKGHEIDGVGGWDTYVVMSHIELGCYVLQRSCLLRLSASLQYLPRTKIVKSSPAPLLH
jgi:hypothetical protein